MTIHPPDNVVYGPHLPDDYDFPWVRAWGRRIELTEEQIDRMVAKAQADRAPHTALIRFTDQDDWLTLDDIESVESRRWLMDYSHTMGIPFPEEVLAHWIDPDFIPPHRSTERPW